MIISKYGITLERLQINDIELVRKNRNLPFINENMHYREYIDKDSQHLWFESINNNHNYYFLIKIKGKKIGLVSAHNCDLKNKTAEGGIFIWDSNYHGSIYPILAALIITDFAFETLKLKKTFAKVMKSNKRGIIFNESLGFEIDNTKTLTKEPYAWYYLTPTLYDIQKSKFSDIINLIT